MAFAQQIVTSDMGEYTIYFKAAHPQGWWMEPHRHSQHEISLVRRGSCQMMFDNASRRLHRGDVFFISGGVPHDFIADAPGGVEFAVIHFRNLDDDLRACLSDNGDISFFRLSDLEQSRFVDLCYQLQRESVGGQPYFDLQLRALIQQVIVLLLRSSEARQSARLTAQQHRAVEAALLWIQEHANDEDLRIGDVAARVGISAPYFRRIFERHTGLSPKRYLLMLRLQHSKHLLLHSERTVSDVAHATGFGTLQQFCKSFRKATGLTPSEWRNAHLIASAGEMPDRPVTVAISPSPPAQRPENHR